MVEIKVKVPLSTFRLIQSAADENQIPVSIMSARQLVKHNEPTLRVRQLMELRQQVYDLWMRGLTTPKIAAELGCSIGTVDKHKRAIRGDFASWASDRAAEA